MSESGWYTVLTYTPLSMLDYQTKVIIPKEAKGIESREESQDEKISFSNIAEISP